MTTQRWLIVASIVVLPWAAFSQPGNPRRLTQEELRRIEERVGGDIFAENADIITEDPAELEAELMEQYHGGEAERVRQKMRKVWEEYEAGERGWRDAHAAAHQMRERTLGEERRKWGRRLKEIREKHKRDLRGAYPVYTSDQLEERERIQRESHERSQARYHRARMREIRAAVALRHADGRRVALFYQGGGALTGKQPPSIGPRRIDFYKLPAGAELLLGQRGNDSHWDDPPSKWGVRGGYPPRVVKDGRTLDVKPHASLTFQANLRWAPSGIWGKPLEASAFLIVSPDMAPLDFFTDLSIPEDHLVDTSTASVDFKEFYGVISFDGRVLARFPFESNYPTAVASLLGISEDGREAAIGVGPVGFFYPGGDETRVVVTRKVFYWKHPNTILQGDPCNPFFAEKIRHLSQITWRGGPTNDTCPELLGGVPPVAVVKDCIGSGRNAVCGGQPVWP